MIHMPRTREEIEQAAADAERWLAAMDPAAVDWDDPTDLRAISAALSAVAKAENRLAGAVATARNRGRSWGEIARILGVSRQAARQRYTEMVTSTPPA